MNVMVPHIMSKLDSKAGQVSLHISDHGNRFALLGLFFNMKPNDFEIEGNFFTRTWLGPCVKVGRYRVLHGTGKSGEHRDVALSKPATRKHIWYCDVMSS